MKMVRLHFDLTQEAAAVLDGLGARREGGIEEALRLGFSLLEVAEEAAEKGLRLAIYEPPGKIVAVIVGL